MSSRLRRLPILLIAVLSFAVLTMGQESCSDLAEEEATVEDGSGSASGKKDRKKKKVATADLGDTVTLKGTAYKVLSAETAESVGENEYTREQANGKFIVVELELTNRKDEPATIISDNMRLIAGNGKNYSTSDDALLAVEDQFLLEEIQPDNTETGTLVFDVPDNAVSGARLQVEDLFSNSKARIRLGL